MFIPFNSLPVSLLNYLPSTVPLFSYLWDSTLTGYNQWPKSDWKLQGNTNTQLKLLCRASYTGKWGGIDIIYLHDSPLWRFRNTQRNFSIVYQNF